ncbi:MAG TPA: RICIN domain-containing protein [Pilimelia sp.]|nr:RICIN domain-containing protein [Pilimelia sp.]
MSFIRPRLSRSLGARTKVLRVVVAAPVAAGLLAVAPATPAAAVPGGTAPAPPVQCVGDGSSGHRVQLLYVYEPGTSRFAEREPYMRAAAWVTQQNVNDSARRDGAQRWIRYLTTSTGCQLIINSVQVPAGTTNSPNWIPTLQSLGYNASNRIYAVLSENHRASCADARNDGINDDPIAGTGNRHNSRTVWLTFQPACFDGPTLTHELAHGLGGVLPSAPHWDGSGHCTDGNETLCGDENTPAVCPDPLAGRLLDCGRDDYFGVVPQGTYLPNHWNAALHSLYLQAGSSTTPMTTIPPLPPQLLRATDVEGTSIAFSFSPSVRPYGQNYSTGYELLRNGVVVATLASHETTVRLTGLPANTSATYVVRQTLWHNGVTRTSVNSQPLTVTTNSSTAAAGAVENGATMLFVNDVVDPEGPKMAMDLFAFDESENAHIKQYPENGKLNQQWKLTAASGGGYTVRNSHSLKCLTPLNGGTAIGTPVVHATCTGTTAQRWTFPLLNGVTYQVKSVSSGRCVQPSGAGWADLALAACSTTDPSQQWTAKRVS